MFKFRKFTLGALLFFQGSFNFLSAHYCPKCVKIETERAEEQAKGSSKPPEYYEDYLNDKKGSAVQEDKSNSSEQANLGAEHAFNWLQFTQKAMMLAANEIQANKSRAANPDNSSLSNQKDLNRANIPLNSSSNNQTSPSPNSLGSSSTVFDILTIKNLFNTFEESFTIFAPSDEAIRNFPSNFFQNIWNPENRELLFTFITNHIVPQQILRQNFNTPFKTLGGRIVEIKMNGNALTVNEDAKVLKSAPLGNGGILYVIDKVLIPIHE